MFFPILTNVKINVRQEFLLEVMQTVNDIWITAKIQFELIDVIEVNWDDKIAPSELSLIRYHIGISLIFML